MVHHGQETFCHIGMLSSPLLLQFQVHGDHTNSRDKLHHRLRSGSTGPGVTQKSGYHGKKQVSRKYPWITTMAVKLALGQTMIKMITLTVIIAPLLLKGSYPPLPSLPL